MQKLQEKAEDPNLWDDPDSAQQIMRQLSRLRNYVEGWDKFEQRAADAYELAGLDDNELAGDIQSELDELSSELEKRETLAMLSGPYDEEDAILAIHAGAGGTDSQDWAQMLMRMYLRWAESRDFETEILDTSEGEEAGIKSTTISIAGDYAYGYLRAEKGVHRLVRLSPFDSANRRHTSFALVEVLPQVQTNEEVEISSNDLRIDTYRSAGAG
ncbi:MAG: PCRF domain-containing protein, partial [Anaerolineales bacterium]